MKTTKSNRRKQNSTKINWHMVKRLVSAILTAAIVVSTFAMTPVSVSAAQLSGNIRMQGTSVDVMSDTDILQEQTNKTYSHENYEIIYTVKSEWESHQAVEITIQNIGETAIRNWAVSIEILGNITGLWNAVLLTAEEKDGNTTVKNAGWNSVIQPGQSVTFGYTLEGENLSVPADILLCSVTEKEQETAETELIITGEWEEGFQGELHIHNHSEKAVSGWSITFYANFMIENLWNGELTSNEDGTYTVSHTVWQNEIPAGGEYVVGLTGTKTGEAPEIADCTVYGVEEYGKTGSSSGEDKPSTGDGTEEETIDWEDTTDTDGDGLPDVYERYMFESDPENADSDGDGLPDGYEVRSAGTSPVLADSNEDGISDGDSDEDGDGLTNMEEYLLGTNPLTKDSDYDGLEDREELETYGTDPLNADTDGDGISDGDEVTLGLDPLNPATNGVPDNQYCVPQEIGTDSAVLKSVNETAGNPYEVSLSFQTSGVAEHNISVDGTSYGTVFDSGAAVGSPFFIEYNDDMNLETIRITYHVNEEIRENEMDLFGDDTTELHGIRRLNVFWFDEEINMLLPVETFHDEEKGLVYADMDKDGIFCLMDMEKWIYGLAEESGFFGIESTAYAMEEEVILESVRTDDENDDRNIEQFFKEAEELFHGMGKGTGEKISEAAMPVMFSLDNEREKADRSRPVDLVYILQTEGSDRSFLENSRIIAWYNMRELEQEYSDVRMCVLEERLDGTYTQAGKNQAYWFKDSEIFSEYLNHIPCKVTDETFYRSALDMVLNGRMNFRKGSVKLVVYVPAGITNIGFYHFEDCLTEMAERGICYSEVHDNSNPYTVYTKELGSYVEKTGGKFFSISDSGWLEEIIKWSRDRIENAPAEEEKPQTEFKGITATGYKTIILEQPLSSTSGWDSDHDGLTDWEEVNTELLLWNRDGSITLPTLLYCVENYSEDSYVIAGLERFKRDVTQHGVPSNIYEDYIRHIMANTEILPIHSHPRRVDTDGDGILDHYNGRFESEYHFADPNPLKVDIRETALKNDFFSVDYEHKEGAEKNWAEKKNGGSVASYGGNQSWFGEYGTLGESKIFCNGTRTGKDIDDYGCGIIAAADTLFYITAGKQIEIPDFKDSSTFSFKNNDYDTYISFVTFISDYFKINRFLNGVPGEYLSGSLDSGFMEFAQDEGIPIRAEWEACFSDEKYKVMEMMKEMLLEDIPIVFSYDNTFDKSKRLTLYTWKEGRFVSDDGQGNPLTTGSHFMTATGIIEYSDDVIEILNRKFSNEIVEKQKCKCMLRISSWGQMFYVDYNEFLDNFSMGTNFLYIVK